MARHGWLLLAVLVLLAMPLRAGAVDTAHEAAAATQADVAHGGSGHDAAAGAHEGEHGGDHGGEHYRPASAPSYFWVIPFVALLLSIAILPLIPATAHWWHHNRNRLLVAVLLAIPVAAYYFFLHPGFVNPAGETVIQTGTPTLINLFKHAILGEYVPFIVLLFSLYTISGGIRLRGDLPAHPMTNTIFLAVGTLLASFIGTTGAAMLLIRPLLNTNSERKHVKHTVIFFIFLVCNVGGCLLPIGDPPLFLGYLMGVPFLWTFHLTAEWAICSAILLVVYFVWDTIAYRHEGPREIRRDETMVQPLRLDGKRNFVYLLGVVLAVALLVPGKPFLDGLTSEKIGSFLGGGLKKIQEIGSVPNYLRELVMLALVLLSLMTTPKGLREANKFTYAAIGEVAALFIGIFITMQPAIEILSVQGPNLGLSQPWQFFWATGGLSSFLDNAPTYVVFFQTAESLTHQPGEGILTLLGGQYIRADLLVAVSLGAVFMGAMTYIGNGPNFMVKAIADERGIRMPSFFGYMVYSCLILLPIFFLLNLVFFVFHLV